MYSSDKIQATFPWYIRMHALMCTGPVINKLALACSTISVSLNILEYTSAAQVSPRSCELTIHTLTSSHSDLPHPFGILKVTQTATMWGLMVAVAQPTFTRLMVKMMVMRILTATLVMAPTLTSWNCYRSRLWHPCVARSIKLVWWTKLLMPQHQEIEDKMK